MTVAERPQIAARFAGNVGGFPLDVDFTAPAQGITALFGPSGCGQTPVLRCIAGLSPLRGRLHLAGDVWPCSTAGTFRYTHYLHAGYDFSRIRLLAPLTRLPAPL